MPPPIKSQSDRCPGDASASRGNHTRGAETTRPSVSVTESESLEHDTSTASASDLSVKVLMPSLQEKPGILDNNCANVSHLIRAKASHFPDQYGIKPKLRIPSGVGDVDVRRFAPLHAENKEPIPPDSEKSGHFPSLPPPAPAWDFTQKAISADSSASGFPVLLWQHDKRPGTPCPLRTSAAA